MCTVALVATIVLLQFSFLHILVTLLCSTGNTGATMAVTTCCCCWCVRLMALHLHHFSSAVLFSAVLQVVGTAIGRFLSGNCNSLRLTENFPPSFIQACARNFRATQSELMLPTATAEFNAFLLISCTIIQCDFIGRMYGLRGRMGRRGSCVRVFEQCEMFCLCVSKINFRINLKKSKKVALLFAWKYTQIRRSKKERMTVVFWLQNEFSIRDLH